MYVDHCEVKNMIVQMLFRDTHDVIQASFIKLVHRQDSAWNSTI